jgi:hypothetical protein
VTCTVERAAPHRITATRTMALVPSVLTPQLPMDFTDYPKLAGRAAARLIVFSGLPGAGKSTLEELFTMGGELLTTLAYRQLALGQSAILDFPAEDLGTRTRWRSLAGAAGAEFRVVICVCSDRELHRARLEGRERGIPGWHDAGNWANVGWRSSRPGPARCSPSTPSSRYR